MEKILTIVIPTYNMQDYLHRCLNSLIVSEEQIQHLEVLVVNDGSKDNSSAIAHEYQDMYPGTFRVIDKEKGV
jgi:glycosyltransferase involved in cell wall biosynthesis